MEEINRDIDRMYGELTADVADGNLSFHFIFIL